MERLLRYCARPPFALERIKQQPDEKELSYGQCLLTMILNGLGYTSQALYLQSDYFSGKAVEKLLGEGI